MNEKGEYYTVQYTDPRVKDLGGSGEWFLDNERFKTMDAARANINRRRSKSYQYRIVKITAEVVEENV